jgi:hypothetical protein
LTTGRTRVSLNGTGNRQLVVSLYCHKHKMWYIVGVIPIIHRGGDGG